MPTRKRHEWRIEVQSQPLRMVKRCDAVGTPGYNQPTLSRCEHRPCQRADHTMNLVEQPMLLLLLCIASDQPLPFPGEIGNGRERDERNNESERWIDRGEKGGRIASEAHSEDTHRLRALRAQVLDERAQVPNRLPESFDRETRIRRREGGSPPGRASQSVVWEHRKDNVKPSIEEPTRRPRTFFERMSTAEVSVNQDSHSGSSIGVSKPPGMRALVLSRLTPPGQLGSERSIFAVPAHVDHLSSPPIGFHDFFAHHR